MVRDAGRKIVPKHKDERVFVVILKPASHTQQIFAEAGKQPIGKEDFAKLMDRLPEDISKKLNDHAIYLSGLKDRGKLLFAGATDDYKDGIIVYAAESIEEAQKLAEGDPFVKSGLFTSYKIKTLYRRF